jgi:two-component system NtrC family response regulator
MMLKAAVSVLHLIAKVAPTPSTVLITGESGTGKELIARAIHYHSLRKDRQFIPVDCAVLSENLLESELFGHVKGSFTGAIVTKPGLFQVADGGSLFLDEIGNISLAMQSKLLRVIQEREFTPVGATKLKAERLFVLGALTRNEWNVTRSSKDVGMLRQNFQALMRKYNIRIEDRED